VYISSQYGSYSSVGIFWTLYSDRFFLKFEKKRKKNFSQTSSAPRQQLSSDSWIGVDGVRVLQPMNHVWTSPISKTAFPKKFGILANRANTVQVFSSQDLEKARGTVKQSPPMKPGEILKMKMENSSLKKENARLKEDSVKPQEVVALKKDNESLKQDNDKLIDGIMTQCRTNYRLKEDLRVMVERAQGYKDDGEDALAELNVAELQVRNLEKILENDELISKAREQAMQRQLVLVVEVQNETVAALKRAKANVANAHKAMDAMRIHIVMLEKEREEERIEKETMREKGTHVTNCLEMLIQESERTVRNMSLMMNL
jgi:hypothetical protein